MRLPRLNPRADSADNTNMRLRFWIGLAAVAVIAVGSVAIALAVRANDNADFHTMQSDEAARAAHQAEALAALSVGELSSAAAFFQVDQSISRHEFNVIAHSLLDEGSLTTAAFLQRVPASKRARFERIHGYDIVERGPGGLLTRAAPASELLPPHLRRRRAQNRFGARLRPRDRPGPRALPAPRPRHR